MSEFENVDFKFKRGTRDGVNHTPVDNGSLVFATDTQEFYVDIDDTRLVLSGIEFYPTENDIKAITVPTIKPIQNTNNIIFTFPPFLKDNPLRQ